MTRKITLLYIDAGGGHRAAANALVEVSRIERRPWEFRLVSIQDVFDSVDFVRRFTGIRFQDVYNIMLRRGWTSGSDRLIRLMHSLIRMSHRSQVRALREFWKTERPDLVVSLIPHFNRAVKESLDSVWSGVPYVTLLTDIADYPPNFWIEKIDQHVICGSARAASQAAELGLPSDRIFRTSGMLVHPRFYEPVAKDRALERVRLDLQPGKPTGLVLFGAEGSEEMLNIARAMERSPAPVQFIMICGRNEKLAADLRRMSGVPMFVEGFTREIPWYMELSDFFVGKPGPGSISEALVKRLPVIVQRNHRTLAHERFNADWVEADGLGLVVRDFSKEIAPAIRKLLFPANYTAYRSRAAGTRNRAVFEIPDLLEQLLPDVAEAPEPVPPHSLSELAA